MAESPTAQATGAHIWKQVKNFDDFAVVCCGRLHTQLLTDPDGFSMCHRVGRIGAATISEIAVGSEMSLDAGELCGAYRIVVLRAGRAEGEYRGLPLAGGPGTATIYLPQGHASMKWSAGTRFICIKFDRSAVDDALSDALGWQVMSQPEFTPVMRMGSAATRSWINMVALFKDQVFRADSVLNQPLVGLPFVDSLVRGFLLAADHPHREALAKDMRLFAPRAIRSAIEIIEEEAHLPLTLTSIATRTHISVRTLQQGFQRHLDTSPMAYLREVRLRRAHHALLRSDPSQVTVASVAYRWGFTNLGRFAAAHSARYRETPTETLRRRTFQRFTAEERVHVRTARRC
ncbi:AraC family transcriptional regulator [Mycobacterium sp. pR1184]|uniref:AraC family transcriptional regulator n=1 Tax=Mycobacterium sp. pR1184 TaxID=3238981 RepID=UPI00351B0BD4